MILERAPVHRVTQQALKAFSMASSKLLSEFCTMQTCPFFPTKRPRSPTETSILTHTHPYAPFTDWRAPTRHTDNPPPALRLWNHNRCYCITQEDPHYLVKVLAGCTNSTQELGTAFVFCMWASVCMSSAYTHKQTHTCTHTQNQSIANDTALIYSS